MFKKIALASVGLLLVASPLIASADTASELRAKIDALLAQVTQLKEQLARAQSASSNQIACTQEAKICPDGSAVGRAGPNCAFAACPGVGQPPKRCIPILRALQRGSRGAEVTALQEFLIERGDLDAEATGYFGVATEAAVANLQIESDVVSSENSGSVIGRGVVGPRTRAIIASQCANPQRKLTASPKAGVAPLTVNFQTNATPNGGTFVIDFGDGESGEMQPGPLGVCDVNTGCTGGGYSSTHTYSASGTYTAKLTERNPGGCSRAAEAQGCLGGPASIRTIGTAVIRVGRGDNAAAPTISGISGPTSLATGRSGTWKVNATGSGGDLSYSVVWGDEDTFDQILRYADAPSRSVQSSATFTHAYARTGTYNPVFTVSNRIGSAKTSASVVVSDSSNIICSAIGWIPPVASSCVGGTWRVTTGENGCQNGWKCVVSNPPRQPDCLAPVSINGVDSCGPSSVPGSGGSESSGGSGVSSGSDVVVAQDAVSISPTSGTVPLTVTTQFTTGSCDSYAVRWGDGQVDSYVYPSSSSMCNQMAATQKKTHRYAARGTYDISVVVNGATVGTGRVTVR